MTPRTPLPDYLRRLAVGFIFTCFAFAGPASLAQNDPPPEDLAAFPYGKLEISDGKKFKLTYEVWLADTPARMAQGLMFVRDLPALRGMLFVHGAPQPVSMWMKNTYIPLDMVFIDAQGRIQEVFEHATPHSLDIIRSKDPALAVLEIGGGEARRLGIHAGQHVIHPALVSH